MQSAIISLMLAIMVALAGLFGVPEEIGGVVQLAFFSLVVVFVFLMVRYLAQDVDDR